MFFLVPCDLGSQNVGTVLESREKAMLSAIAEEVRNKSSLRHDELAVSRVDHSDKLVRTSNQSLVLCCCVGS